MIQRFFATQDTGKKYRNTKRPMNGHTAPHNVIFETPFQTIPFKILNGNLILASTHSMGLNLTCDCSPAAEHSSPARSTDTWSLLTGAGN